LSQTEIEESLNLLEKDWDVDPIIRKFVLGKITFYGNAFGLTVTTVVIDKADYH
jgi:hypothetical protein